MHQICVLNDQLLPHYRSLEIMFTMLSSQRARFSGFCERISGRKDRAACQRAADTWRCKQGRSASGIHAHQCTHVAWLGQCHSIKVPYLMRECRQPHKRTFEMPVGPLPSRPSPVLSCQSIAQGHLTFLSVDLPVF